MKTKMISPIKISKNVLFFDSISVIYFDKDEIQYNQSLSCYRYLFTLYSYDL